MTKRQAAYEGAVLLGHEIVGSGHQAVIVLHEWLGNHENYKLICPVLDKNKFTYIFANLRGYGLSKEHVGTYTIKEAVGDVLTLMDYLGHHYFHVVGHSMSGMIAQYLMVTASHRVKNVVCVSPVPASGFRADANTLLSLQASISDDAAICRAIDARTGGRYGTAWLDYKLSIARQASSEAMAGYLRMFTSTDFSARIKGITSPLSVIIGNQDIPFYRRDSIEPILNSLFKYTRVSEIHDAGHYSMLEVPALFVSLLEQGLSRPEGNS
ncbi:alpha/beta fold hydrolase [Gluconacetobacter asukensis]|uniref:Alpha/beta hydrolase n=1 Tax=Gluconacetobacter asukensis TaxID=1017181 RepID=A0A7W4P172_9PROT|nr:alpha/beta hydrolase [Gluconacetobacter asukensis]MBB2173667.1 alpha/beta hydrolase [Gluconacetobacter asukensis]